MNEWKIQSLVGALSAIIYVALFHFMSFPFFVEVVITVAIVTPVAAWGRKLLETKEEKSEKS